MPTERKLRQEIFLQLSIIRESSFFIRGVLLINWFIEGYITSDQTTRRLEIDKFPFYVGRDDKNELVVHSGEVSRKHAQFLLDGQSLKLEDLGSTNGTFVNRQRLTQSLELHHGDILRFGNMEYRVIAADDLDQLKQPEDPEATCLSMKAFDASVVPEGISRIRELLDQHMVAPVFQPIVDLNGHSVGFELLGRGAHPDLPVAPVELFALAESAGLEIELSEVFRKEGLKAAVDSGIETDFFVNTHPAELEDPDRLIHSIWGLRDNYPDMQLTLEIHEQGVTDTQKMKELQSKLRELDIEIAYDDFGAGQSRLVELVEATPKVVKFDICLIRDIHKATEARLKMLRLLMQMCREMGVKTLAEGVGCKEEADVCVDLKFDLMQGFHYGKPAPLLAPKKSKRFGIF